MIVSSAGIPPGGLHRRVELRQRLRTPAPPIGHPAVGVVGDRLEQLRAPATAEEDRRMGLLHRLRPRERRREVARAPPSRRPASSVQSAFMASMRSLTTARRSAKATPWSASSSTFQPKPIPNTKRPPRDEVERGHRLGRHDRVPLGDEGDAGADPQALGHRGRRGQRDERVERAVVLLAERLPRRRRRRPAGGDVGVLGHVEGDEAPVLAGPGQLDRPDRQVRREHGDAELHVSNLSQ